MIVLLPALGVRPISALGPAPTLPQADPAIGKWKARPPGGLHEQLWYWTLEIRPDGTFRQHVDLAVMVHLFGDGKGTWRREAGGIRLRGEATESADDGHGKSMHTTPIDDLLTERAGKLILSQSLPDEKADPSDALVFRRVATFAREPDPPAPVPDPNRRAGEIWSHCRRAYRSLGSYRASGSVFDQGNDPERISARFGLRYASATGLSLRFDWLLPAKRRFSLMIKTAANSSSVRAVGEPKEHVKGRWGALDLLHEVSGCDLGILAELALPPASPTKARYRNFQLFSDSVVEGVPCDNLGFTDRDRTEWIVSIGKRDHLIRLIEQRASVFRIRIQTSRTPAPIR